MTLNFIIIECHSGEYMTAIFREQIKVLHQTYNSLLCLYLTSNDLEIIIKRNIGYIFILVSNTFILVKVDVLKVMSILLVLRSPY